MMRCLIILLLFVGQVNAQKIVATASQNKVPVHTPFQVTYKIGESISNFEKPDFKNFKVISGPSRSQSTRIINGVMSFSATYSYTLMPMKEGEFTISPASATTETGSKINSNPLKIKVEPKSSIKIGDEADYFVRMELSDTIASVGQKVEIRYVLYSKTGVAGVDVIDEYNYDGFHKEVTRQPPGYQEVKINGKPFYRRILIGYDAYAQRSGTYDIEGFTVNVQVPEKGAQRDYFGRIATTSKYLAAENKTLEIKKLPGNAPSSFSGGIGNFMMEASSEDTDVTTDDAITIRMKIIGTGDPKYWDYPKLNVPDSWEAYDPKVIAERRSNLLGNATQKLVEYVFLPKKVGKFEVTPELSYYNTDSLKYTTITAPTIDFNIKKGNAVVEEIAQDEESEVVGISDSKTNIPLILGGILALGLSVFLLTKVFKKKEEKEVNIPKEKVQTDYKNKAKSIAIEQLKTAKKYFDNQSNKEFYPEISLALNRYLIHKYNVTSMDMNAENIANVLKENQVAETDISEYIDIMKKCEMAIYAGYSNDDNLTIYNRALDLIQRIER